MQPRFLLIGATGYTGKAVAQYLRSKNIDCIAHIRPNSPNLETAKQFFTGLSAEVDTSAWTPDDFSALLQKHEPSHIFSLLGTTKAKAKHAAKTGEKATYEDVDRDLSLLLLQAAVSYAAQRPDQDPPKYLFLSSMGVSDGSANRYIKARADVEKQVRQSPIPWLIARPSFISGPDRPESRPMERFGSLFGDAVLSTMALVGIKKPYQLYGTLSAAQLASGLVEWALDDAAYSQLLDTAAIRQRIKAS